MDDNLGVECVCLSIVAVQSDQGQAPTEKGPVPQLMSSIIQMESLLSRHCAVVHTLLSQAVSPHALLPHFDALPVYCLLKCMWENKAPWSCWLFRFRLLLCMYHPAGDHLKVITCLIFSSSKNNKRNGFCITVAPEDSDESCPRGDYPLCCQYMVSAQDQTAGGHRAKGTKKTANTKCQQIEEYHPVCLSHCGVTWKKQGEELWRSAPADRRSSSE